MGGQLVEWRGERAFARGLDTIALGDMVSIDGAGQAIVCGLHTELTELAPLSLRTPVANAGVRRIGPHVVPAGTALIGRTIDATGEPTDARGPLRCDTLHRVFGRDPMTIPEVRARRLTLGLPTYDLQMHYSRGSSAYLVGSRSVAHHIMSHQHAADLIAIVASPRAGKRGHQAARRPTLPCIHVAPPEDASSVQQWLVPWVAVAIADGLRAQGRDVVVLIDDLEGWKPHVVHGLPRGSWATQIAQLASRAYALETGSVTVFARVREPTAAITAAFDLEIDLERALRGLPAHAMSKYVRPPFKVPQFHLLVRAVMDSAQLGEIERRMPWFRAQPKLDLTTRRMIASGEKAREVMRYRDGMTLDSLEQLACVLGVMHVLELQAEAVGAFIEAYLPALRKEHGARLDQIRTAGSINEDDLRALLALATATAAPFLLS